MVNRRGWLGALAVLCCTLPAACYRPPAQQAASPAGTIAFPPGVDHALSGINADPSIPNPCCWLAPNAAFETVVPAHASQLTLIVWAPDDIPKLRKHFQRITVTADGQTKTFSKISIGTTKLDMALRPAATDRMVVVKMHMDLSFTPKEELNLDDLRRLSIYLKSVQAW